MGKLNVRNYSCLVKETAFLGPLWKRASRIPALR